MVRIADFKSVGVSASEVQFLLSAGTDDDKYDDDDDFLGTTRRPPNMRG